ncbi:MAG: hypothetical protein RLZZ08_1406 [Pseudomonadota bacterium]|jgi:hypothetical protein
MISRRDMLKWGVIAPAVAGMPAAVSAAAPQGIDALVLDRRFSALDQQPAFTAPVKWIDGDVTKLWFEQLDLRWRQPGFVLGGITGPDALWVLDVLARDRGRRVTARKVLPVAAGEVAPVSWVIAPVHPSVKG